MKKPNKKLIPKGALGLDAGIGLGMSAVSGIMGIIQQNKLKKEQAKQEGILQQNNLNNAIIEQDVYNDQFINNNINDLPVYAKGGNIPKTNNLSTKGKFDTTGGDLLPISNNADVVVGNKHSEKKIDNSYGVTLSKDGQPVANIEDEEVVVDNKMVFSDKLKKGNKTFADIALEVNTKIGELESNLESSKKPSETFAIKRTIQGLQNKNDNLFKEQELVKQNTVGDTQEMIEVENGVVEKGANGLNLYNRNRNTNFNDFYPDIIKSNKAKGDVVNLDYVTKSEKEEEGLESYASLAPLVIDNITNAILTTNSPKPPKPLARRSPILNTNVNVNPALAEIKNTIASGNEVVRGNTNNSAVARANITANNLRGLEASSNILANKEAQEIQLKNNQNKILTDTANANMDLQDEYQQDVYQNKIDRANSTSDNFTNFVEDYTAVKRDINTDRREQSIIDLDLLRDPTRQKERDLASIKNIMNKRKQRLLRK